ncbi:hypothetical protein H0H87_012155 [Tephrocybe sp. NHM501043]|nr:hypothetical protein H0H87_012155 [Tephrocybe sp. NHM501043]
MQDEELQRLTASEPLSLEEEYEMQQKWRLDADKLTFIILSRESLSGDKLLNLTEIPETVSPTDPTISRLPMVGDVNMFLKGALPRETQVTKSADAQDDEELENEFEAEMEIMIAEPAFRRKRLALEALQLMLEYATGFPSAYFSENAERREQNLGQSKGLGVPPSRLVARISDTNGPSIRLFEMLGFSITRRVEVFEEVEMRFKASDHGRPLKYCSDAKYRRPDL